MMSDIVLLASLLIFSFSFFCGALSAKNKRGRYLDKPIYDFVPTTIVKIIIAIIGIIFYLYLIYINWINVDKILFIILLMSLIIITIGFLIIVFSNKIYKLLKKKDENNDKNNNNIFLNENIKEIFSIMDTAMNNGCIVVLIIFTITIIILHVINIYVFNIEGWFETFSFGNVYCLMLFDSILLLIFSLSRYCRYIASNIKFQDENNTNYIEANLNDEVNN